MTDFFYLPDRIFMLFSYENRKNKFPINFSSPRLRRTNTYNFTSGWAQNRARRETGDSGPVTSIQERCFRECQWFCCAKHRQPKLNIREPLNYKDLYGNTTNLCKMVESNIVLSINKVNLPRFYLYSLSFTSFSSRFEAISAS